MSIYFSIKWMILINISSRQSLYKLYNLAASPQGGTVVFGVMEGELTCCCVHMC